MGMAAPALPPGCKSWIVLESTEEKAKRLRQEREERMQAERRKRKREDDYKRWEKGQRALRKKEERQRQQRQRALERLHADTSIDQEKKERLEQELAEFGAEDVEEVLRLEEDELADL